MIASVSGEAKPRVTMCYPMLSEHPGRGIGDRHTSILGSFAAMNMHQPTGSINAAHLQVQGLVHPQAQRIDGPEVGSHSKSRRRMHDGMDLINRKHFR
ncbi:hypothetical protein Poly21_15290 [Allorhodopirellula heiligendammensis]|uniref:Uncharacterized protein n=1 Tax=Allorhodopirellula heiligendammensis TaxID=2714739 RepID=A0A5C6C5S3_9BACT|nr:hypothetical protein Poly21_15290 [Allorhodopirellula heiligendammensis]